MRVVFRNDYSVIINDDTIVKLGDILLEFVSGDFSDFYLLCDNLVEQLKKVASWENENTELKKYLKLANQVRKLEIAFQEKLLMLPFYRISKPKYLFATDVLISETSTCLEFCNENTMLADANFRVNFDYHNAVVDSIKNYKKVIFQCSVFFKELMEFCLFGENISPIERLSEYTLDKVFQKIDEIENGKSMAFSLEHKIQMINEKPVLIEVYNLTTPTQFLYQDFINLVKNGLRIKKCANCQRYFVLFSGHSIEYCDNIPEGEKKPCSVIGSARQYSKKVKDDPILENYTRSYKTHFSRKRAGYLTDEQFKKWAKEAKDMRARAYKGEVTVEEFGEWCRG